MDYKEAAEGIDASIAVLRTYTGQEEQSDRELAEWLASEGWTKGVRLDENAFVDRFVVAMSGCRREYVSTRWNDRTDARLNDIGQTAHEVYVEMMQELE